MILRSDGKLTKKKRREFSLSVDAFYVCHFCQGRGESPRSCSISPVWVFEEIRRVNDLCSEKNGKKGAGVGGGR